jgi:hypothetical protein
MTPHPGSDDLQWRLGGVTAEFVEIVVQSRADAADFWDGNWLACRIEVAGGGCRARCSASLRAEEIADFHDALAALSAGTAHAAAFTTLEEQIALRLHRDAAGRVQVTGSVQDRPGDGNSLQFTLELDQSYLPDSLAQLGRLVARFPVRGIRAG